MSDEQDKVHWAVDAVKNLGVPTVLLVVLVYGGWQMVSWAGAHVVTPLVDKQMSFMDKLEQTARTHADSLKKVSETLESIQKTEERQERILEELVKDGDDGSSQ